MMSNDPIWFSPIRAYSEYLGLAENVGTEVLESDPKYKRVIETRALAILCFALYVANNKTPWFLQLCRNDPPDGLIMRASPTRKGDHELMGVEVTSYSRNRAGLPKDPVFEQLKKTKMFKDYHKYTDHDIILVDLGWHYRPDFEEIHKYMAKIKAPYQVWFLQEIQSMPDTIAEMTICSSEHALQRRVNIGKAWHEMKQQNIPGAIRTQRVGNINKVGAKKGEPIFGAPWEMMV